MLRPRDVLHLWAPGFAGFGGGITAFSRELADALVAVLPEWCISLFGKGDRRGRWGSLPLRGAGGAALSLRTPWFALQLASAALNERPRLIVSTHLNFGPVARAIAVNFRIPYVLVAHGIDVHPGLSDVRRAALAHADAVWAVSDWTRSRLTEVGVSPGRIAIVPNTICEQAFRPAVADASLRARYGLRPNEKTVLTVARLDAGEGYKGYDKVLRALPAVCDAVGDVRYLVVGRGSDSQSLARLAQELGVSDRLTLCGFVPDAELPAHYGLADAFAMPSMGEGFGIVFLEAMASGVPVLAGNRDGSVDALAGGELGRLVDPEDVNKIAAGLIELLQRRGPAMWFDPAALRAACLARYGRSAFRSRVQQGLALAIGESP